MSVTGLYFVRPTLDGDLDFSQHFESSPNPYSRPDIRVTSLGIGDNNITAFGQDSVVFILIPPVGNTNTITVRGTTGDVAMPIHKENPFILSRNPGAPSNVIVNAASTIADVITVTI